VNEQFAWNAAFLARALRSDGMKYLTADSLKEYLKGYSDSSDFGGHWDALSDLCRYGWIEQCSRRWRNADGVLVYRYRVVKLFESSRSK